MPTADFAHKVETTLESIDENDAIHPDNKQAIREFKRDLKLDGKSDAWLQKLTAHLKVIAEHLGDTRFEDLEKDDMKDLVEWAQDRTKENGEPVSESTVGAYKQVLKRFYRWLHDLPSGEHPEVTDWINTTTSSKNGTLPTDLLTKDDVKALKDGTRNDRDRALIGMLWETGARIGELIDLTVGDIEDGHRGKKVVVDGKTGQRRLPLVESAPAINDWLNRHPDPVDDAPLWCKIQQGETGAEQVSYDYIRQKILGRAKERADLEKPVNPHHFRHSRATYLASKSSFKQPQLCEFFGWVQGSDVPARYIHLSGRDIDDAYMEMQGLKPQREDEAEDGVVECWRCAKLEEPDRRFCGRCGAPLDEEGHDTEVEVQQDVGAAKALADDAEGLSAEAINEAINEAVERKLKELRSE